MRNPNCTHVAGFIPGAGEVSTQNWNRELCRFAMKVEDFNVRGQYAQVSHPGFIVEAHFCSECGARLDRQALGLQTLLGAMELVTAARPHHENKAQTQGLAPVWH